jgi:MFS family permease
LALLTVIVAFNYTDRFALGIALQDIKRDLQLSDSQLGFLSGIAFALFYSTMGIPIARWADRGNRITIIAVATSVWSAAVAACGLARSFLQLMLVRVVVGVGEAGCVPPGLSLIADFFSRAERARAVSVYMQGISASLVLGYLASGWLNQMFGWRAMFLLIGLPGVLLAVLAQWSLKEPRREQTATAHVESSAPAISDVCRTLWATRSFRHLLCANAVMWFISYGTMQWTPAFFIRDFSLETGELGTWFALLYGIGGIVGTYCGGEWAARQGADNEALQLKGMAVLIAISGVLNAFAYLPALAPNSLLALAWLGVSYLMGALTNGPLFAIIQTVVPARVRAMAIAVVYLVANLIGIGLGPWATGALSDAFHPRFGEESLRYALVLMCPGAAWGAYHLWAASRTVAGDIASAQSQVESLRAPGIELAATE